MSTPPHRRLKGLRKRDEITGETAGGRERERSEEGRPLPQRGSEKGLCLSQEIFQYFKQKLYIFMHS